MDTSALLSALLSSGNVSGVSEETGASKADVTSVLTAALPSLLAGEDKKTAGKKAAKKTD